MDVKNLGPDLIEEARGCESSEELMELAKKHGFELSDETLAGISGGWGSSCANYCERDSCADCSALFI